VPISTASSKISLVEPTPTSSFDAPTAADTHLTINDKVALGVGIPLIFIALSTLGYWRAVKFFLHRKITGEPKLPTCASETPAHDGSREASIKSGFSSRPLSLWGAASTHLSNAPSDRPGYGDTELLTAPRNVHSSADISRPSSAASNFGRSNLRQEWHAV
jgi:hypothetical protein